jgi:hypothetical protein
MLKDFFKNIETVFIHLLTTIKLTENFASHAQIQSNCFL